MPNLNEICGRCGHEYKFHIDAFGIAQACDVEEPPLVLPIYGGADKEPDKCGCNQFVPESVAAKAAELLTAPEWRCPICGAEGGDHGPGCVLYEQ